ncbi:jg14377 [Pararge aegeria aegeria]|uniref:Jg14377 protein n=1 Tax=Pararge aegeria aegeria TaxID=348720 RepID=A0A8S4SG63_9NEOP|nr:jg14377 [Pararge aegeria aegeria]
MAPPSVAWCACSAPPAAMADASAKHTGPAHAGCYKLLPPGRTIDSELYCEQLMRLKQEVERKRSELSTGVWFFIMITLDLTHL